MQNRTLKKIIREYHEDKNSKTLDIATLLLYKQPLRNTLQEILKYYKREKQRALLLKRKRDIKKYDLKINYIIKQIVSIPVNSQ